MITHCNHCKKNSEKERAGNPCKTCKKGWFVAGQYDIMQQAVATRCIVDAMSTRDEKTNRKRELAGFLNVFHPEIEAGSDMWRELIN